MPEEQPTLLIVDDMVNNITVLDALLHDEYKIKIAKSGQKALDIIASGEKIDLILLDIEMPDMNGYEVCKRLKENTRTQTIPIIFITAKNEVEDEAYGLDLGAVDYVTKPFHPTIIKARVRNHVKHKLKNDLLEELSMRDGLTQIHNRRYFDEHYLKSYQQALREGKSLCVLMMDVDHFKLYNDHYGHGRGDECLVKVAKALSVQLKRPLDYIARYGGEEFVAVLFDLSSEGAAQVAQNLLDAVRALEISHEFSATAKHVSLSIGLMHKSPSCTLCAAELLHAADEALYLAKESGRNRYAMKQCE